MILEKVYDELYGMIEDLKKKVGKGGSVVTITPTLQSGEKLADYSIDGTEGAIYGPDYSEFFDIVADETLIGTYKDAPLYRKIIDIQALPSSATSLQTPHSISNLDQIVGFTAIGGSSQSATHNKFTFPYFTFDAGTGVNATDCITCSVNDTNVIINVGRDRSDWSAAVAIYYTKTPPTETKKTTKKK